MLCLLTISLVYRDEICGGRDLSDETCRADFSLGDQQFETVQKNLVEYLTKYDKLFEWSKQSVIRILNDDDEQRHGIPLVAAWVPKNEALLDYCINCLNNC